MTWKERKQYIKYVWSHYFEQLDRAKHLTPTYFWECVRATIAILLNRYHDGERHWSHNWREVAWFNFGTYWTDYGTGQSWDTIAVCGFKYTMYDDGSL